MKKIRLLSLLGVVVLAGTLAGCNKTNTPTENPNNTDVIIETNDTDSTAIQYNDNIVNLAQQCFNSEESIRAAYEDESTSVSDIQNAINNTLSECRNVINEINDLGDLEGDSSLRDGVVAMLEKDIEYYGKFSELLPFLEIEDELTEEQAATYDQIVNEINAIDEELDAANNNLIAIQESFAENHEYELELDEE